MKVDIVQTLFALVALVIAAAAQDMLGAWSGVKAPVLLSLALAFACSRHFAGAVRIGAALAAGALAGALSALPPGAAELGFLALSGMAHFAARHEGLIGANAAGRAGASFGFCAMAAAAPAFETWLYFWGTPGTEGVLVARALAALLLGAPLGAAMFALSAPTGEFLGLKAEGENE